MPVNFHRLLLVPALKAFGITIMRYSEAYQWQVKRYGRPVQVLACDSGVGHVLVIALLTCDEGADILISVLTFMMTELTLVTTALIS